MPSYTFVRTISARLYCQPLVDADQLDREVDREKLRPVVVGTVLESDEVSTRQHPTSEAVRNGNESWRDGVSPPTGEDSHGGGS
jgi:hypothetical protein